MIGELKYEALFERKALKYEEAFSAQHEEDFGCSQKKVRSVNLLICLLVVLYGGVSRIVCGEF